LFVIVDVLFFAFGDEKPADGAAVIWLKEAEAEAEADTVDDAAESERTTLLVAAERSEKDAKSSDEAKD
jgi:hypothetical protein